MIGAPALPARMPPGVKSSVPASTQVATIAGRNSTSDVPEQQQQIDAAGADGLVVRACASTSG